jgi:hypothetical protein
MCNLIYVHIGEKEPEYIFDSIYQALLVSPTTKIYILINSSLINTFQTKIKKFNINLYTKQHYEFNLNIEYIPLEILNSTELNEYHQLSTSILNKETLEFRDNFWVSTTTRFFYLARFIELFQLKNCIHIENDIMIYTNLNTFISQFEISCSNKGIYLVQDSISPVRVVPSIIFIKNYNFIKILVNFILNQLKFTKHFQNDMDLLGKFSLERTDIVLKFPFNFENSSSYLTDAATIGQFLGGVDPRNLEQFIKGNSEQKKMIMFNNPSKGFINETSIFKPNETNVKIFKKNTITDMLLVPLKLVYATKETSSKISLKQIVNLHIHSKQLYQFSSIFNLNYSDIITGDRICSLCDFILTTEEIYSFHKNLQHFVKPDNIIIIKNFNSINIDILNNILLSTGKKTIKLFIYTHMLTGFTKNILFKLSTKLKYHIYLHNSDHALGGINYNKLKDANHITKVYSQNIEIITTEETETNKFNILPIGLENSMWNSSNILTLYEIMSKNYLLSKTKNLYININPKTFAYRQIVLNELSTLTFNITTTRKPFNEYLHELSTHRFCLAIRGNGISTHREWESMYLGTIPVFINNKFTDNNTHIRYFEKLNLPFYEITEENFDKYSDDFFNERLYKKIMKNCGESIYNLDALKLSYYTL